jgi:hypothetical protein
MSPLSQRPKRNFKLWTLLGLVALAVAVVVIRWPVPDSAAPTGSGPIAAAPTPAPAPTASAPPADPPPASRPPAPVPAPASAIFSTPLIAAPGGAIPPDEARALTQLQQDYVALGGQENPESARKIAAFLQAFPTSAYAVSLLQEQSTIQWRNGYFTDSLSALTSAWEKGKSFTEPHERRLAEAALARLLPQLSDMGRKEELRALLAEVKDRVLGGSAQEARTRAREVMWFLDHKPEQNVFCGFSAANEICVPTGKMGLPRFGGPPGSGAVG